MSFSTIILLLLSFVAYSESSSLLSFTVLAGQEYTHHIIGGAEKSEGIKRNLETANVDTWQYFYFCDIPKNKKKCGAWVDEKGTKIKGANNNVKRSKEGAIISKMKVEDAGSYAKVPENKDKSQALFELAHVRVTAPPPPPPPPKSH